LSPLALVLENVLDEEDDRPEDLEGRIVGIFYFFSQAENYVKEVVADHVVLKRTSTSVCSMHMMLTSSGVLKGLHRMTAAHQITMLKFIKNISMLSTTLESLHAAHAIELLIDLLSASMKKAPAHFREMSNQVLNTMYNLCRLSKVRQEDAAANGIIPLLQKIMKKDRPPKEFALPILCDMAHSGKVGRKYLWQNKGLQFYISLLEDQYWQVTALDAIFIWYILLSTAVSLPIFPFSLFLSPLCSPIKGYKKKPPASKPLFSLTPSPPPSHAASSPSAPQHSTTISSNPFRNSSVFPLPSLPHSQTLRCTMASSKNFTTRKQLSDSTYSESFAVSAIPTVFLHPQKKKVAKR